MNLEQLEKGKKLVSLIDTTQKALAKIVQLLDKNAEKESDYLYDGHYSLVVCEHTDGSGVRADLGRSFGNKELLVVIKATLEKQLNELKTEFEEL